MQYQYSMKFILFIVISLLITACSTTAPMTDLDKERSAAQQLKKQRIKEMLFESTYMYKGYKVVRFDQGRFMIYDDIKKAPSFYGIVKLDGDEIYFISKKRQLKQSLDINETAIILSAGERKNILLKQDGSSIKFYQPQNIFEAIGFGTLDDLNVLLNNEVSLDEADDLGALPLSDAVYYNRKKMVKALLDAKADIQARNANGHTALHVAIEARNLEMMRILFQSGALQQLKKCEDFLEVIQRDESFLMSKMMIQNGMSPSCSHSSLLFWVISSETLAQKNQTLAALDYLLSQHIRTDVVSPDQGDTPLMRAAAIGNEHIVKKLIDHGVNVFKRDRLGRTALDYDSLYLSEVNPKISLLLHEAGLHTGIKVESDILYQKASNLLAYGETEEAYEAFSNLALKYKQKRFYQGMIQAGLALKTPSMKIIKHLIENFAYVNHEETESFYLTMIRFYKKMLPLVHNKEDLDAHGNFKSGSKWYVYEKIDRLYFTLYNKFKKTNYLYERWENYKNLNKVRNLQRLDIHNSDGTRYVGETLDGIPFGKGALHFKDGSKYYGDVFNYIRHGKGKMIYSNGEMYDGQWKEDVREGKGFFTDSFNALYLSDFKNDIQIGEKKLLRPGTEK